MPNLVTRRALLLGGLVTLSACGSRANTGAPSPTTETVGVGSATPATIADTAAAPTRAAAAPERTLKIGAIPDAAREKLQQTNQALATYLAKALGVKVDYLPVHDHASAVTKFRHGDLDLVWFSGLTGVQARLQTPGSSVLAQRDIDDDVHSVFIVNASTGLSPFAGVADLTELKGLRFTFGSEASTSGRLMPQFFLDQAGVDPRTDFSGTAGFSGSPDKTVDLVAAGTFQAGVLDEQVWKRRSADGSIDSAKVVQVLRSPGYHDYHWIAGPDIDRRLGAGFTARIKAALLGAAGDTEGGKALGLLGAKAFVPTSSDNYVQIEAIGRTLGLIS